MLGEYVYIYIHIILYDIIIMVQWYTHNHQALHPRLILATPLVYVSGLSVAAANGAGKLGFWKRRSSRWGDP